MTEAHGGITESMLGVTEFMVGIRTHTKEGRRSGPAES
jgi:hypothetical protein